MNLLQERKKYRERFVFDRFRKSYIDFPCSNLIHDDKPDFTIKLNDKIIGIEITQIFVDNHLSQSSKIKEREVLRGFLGDRLCKKLSLLMSFKFILSIDFSNKFFYKNDINRIVCACEQYFKEIKFSIESLDQPCIENLGQLPEEIDCLYLFRNEKLNSSSFWYADQTTLPTLELQNFEMTLHKKEAELKDYKKCDEYWLLIEEGAFPSDSFGDISIKEFKTAFDKVFLYRKAHNQTLRLK